MVYEHPERGHGTHHIVDKCAKVTRKMNAKRAPSLPCCSRRGLARDSGSQGVMERTKKQRSRVPLRTEAAKAGRHKSRDDLVLSPLLGNTGLSLPGLPHACYARELWHSAGCVRP